MKKKTGLIATSVASIAVCASLIAGSTYALFTSEDKVDITVKSGNVAVETTIGALTATTTLDPEYSATGEKEVAFQTGGKASVTASGVELGGIVPGDQVSFTLNIDNSKTTVTAQYRITYEVTEGYILADGLDVKIGGVSMEDEKGSYKTYASAWSKEVASTVKVEIALPNHGDISDKTDNLYMGLSTNIVFKVEAVQGNAVTSDESAVTYLPDSSDAVEAFKNNELVVLKKGESLGAALTAQNSGKYILLTEDADRTLTGAVRGLDNVTVDANGLQIVENEGSLAHMTGSDITVKNAVFVKGAKNPWGIYSAGVNYYNCVFNGLSPYIDSQVDMTVDGCTFNNTTLQYCFSEGTNLLPGNLVITNNVFNVNNTDANAHAIVFNGGEKSEWEVVPNVTHTKKIVIEGNTFNPVYREKSYVAYYIVADGQITGKVRMFANNTFNGLAKYSVNSIGNQYNLVSNTVKLDLTKGEEALGILCPDCYNGNVATPHSEHSIHNVLEINDGVATVKSAGAWLSNGKTDWSKKHVLSYDLDVSALSNNGDTICMDFGENKAWQSLVFAIQKTESGFIVGRGTDLKNLKNTQELAEKTSFAIKCTAYVNEEGKFVREVEVDGTVVYTEIGTTKFGDLYWNVYGCVGSGAKISNFVVG